jgi:putative ABC transport system ATP-binding protein
MSAAFQPALFRVRGLSKRYIMGDVEVDALRGVDLDIVDGEIVVVLGPSGSGKSTLLHILGGLDTPTEGTVSFAGVDITAADDAALTAYRRKDIGFIFQFYNLIPSLTARENVEIVTDLVTHPLPAANALRLVGLEARANHFPSQLSGGEQQRVAIARAIAKRPRVLLCDEPTGALDVDTGRVVVAALERINRELRTTVVIITHNAAIGGIADRVMTMGSGALAGIRTNEHKTSADALAW